MARNVWNKMIDKGTAATTAIAKTDLLKNIMLIVDSTGDAVDSTFTITVYDSQDATGILKTALGINPSLSATRDSDGAIAFGEVSTVLAYEIPGRHKYIYITITGVTDDIVVTVWIGGTENA